MAMKSHQQCDSSTSLKVRLKLKFLITVAATRLMGSTNHNVDDFSSLSTASRESVQVMIKGQIVINE